MTNEVKIKRDANFYGRTYQDQLKFEVERLNFRIERLKKELQVINNLIQIENERISKYSKS